MRRQLLLAAARVRFLTDSDSLQNFRVEADG
jgi:hypothetical protein